MKTPITSVCKKFFVQSICSSSLVLSTHLHKQLDKTIAPINQHYLWLSQNNYMCSYHKRNNCLNTIERYRNILESYYRIKTCLPCDNQFINKSHAYKTGACMQKLVTFKEEFQKNNQYAERSGTVCWKLWAI